ncbi:mucin-5AC [Silurus meridionalis]|nr:mucin-5AC [Silurus meridionalis]
MLCIHLWIALTLVLHLTFSPGKTGTQGHPYMTVPEGSDVGIEELTGLYFGKAQTGQAGNSAAPSGQKREGWRGVPGQGADLCAGSRFLSRPTESLKQETEFRQYTSFDGDVSPPGSSDGDVSPPGSFDGDVSPPGSSDGDVSPPGSFDGDVSPPGSSDGDVSPPGSFDGDVSPPGSSDGDVSPPGSFDGDVSPPGSSDGDVSPPGSFDGDVSPPGSSDGDVSPPGSFDGDVSPPGSSDGDVSPPGSFDGDVSPPGSSDGDVSPPGSFDGDVSPPGSSDGDVSPPGSFDGDVSPPGSSDGDVSPPGSFDGDVSPPGSSDGDVSPPGSFDGDVSPPGSSDGDVSPPGSFDGDVSPPGSSDGDVSPPGSFDGDVSPPGSSDGGVPLLNSTVDVTRPLDTTGVVFLGPSSTGCVTRTPISATDVAWSLSDAGAVSPDPAFVLAPIFAGGFTPILASAMGYAPFRTSAGSMVPSRAFGLSIVRFLRFAWAVAPPQVLAGLLRFCGGSDQVPFDPGRTPGSSSEYPGPPSVCGFGASAHGRDGFALSHTKVYLSRYRRPSLSSVAFRNLRSIYFLISSCYRMESPANKTLTDVSFGRRESGCRSDADMLLPCCMAARATGEHAQAHKNALGYTPPALGKTESHSPDGRGNIPGQYKVLESPAYKTLSSKETKDTGNPLKDVSSFVIFTERDNVWFLFPAPETGVFRIVRRERKHHGTCTWRERGGQLALPGCLTLEINASMLGMEGVHDGEMNLVSGLHAGEGVCLTQAETVLLCVVSILETTSNHDATGALTYWGWKAQC